MSASDQTIAALQSELRRSRTMLAESEQVAHDLRIALEESNGKVAALERRIHQMSKRIFGKSSERHHPGQQTIDLGIPAELPEPPESTAVVTPLASDTPASAPSSPDKSNTKPAGKCPQAGRHPGRRPLPVGTEVVVEDVLVPEQDRLDRHGKPLPLLGYRTSDKWDFRRGTYLLKRTRLAIYGRPFSESQDRISAPQPLCLVPRGKFTDAALIHTVIEKFADHLPLYRQEQRAARQGIQLSRATLVTHVAVVANAFRPIYEAIAQRVRCAPFVHLDDTPVKMIDPGRGHAATARIWVYRSALESAYQFTTTREGRHPASFLGAYRGFVIADAYAGHERLYGPGLATPMGCWAHVRRKFNDLYTDEPFARSMVDDIQRLYVIEKELAMVDDADRQRVRQQRSMPWLDHIRQRLEVARATVLPSSALGHAISYASTRWPTLTPYTAHGFLPIDNNPAENALRPWAVGRKNWLFLGSPAGGERAAVVATIIENCRMQGMDPYAYMLETVAALHRGCRDFAALTPLARSEDADRICG